MLETLRSIGHSLMLALLHCIAGVGASLVVGFLPEALMERYYVNTGIEPFAPVIAAIALILGLALGGRVKGGQGASWVWIFGLLWLALGINDFRKGWNPSWSSRHSSLAYAMANLLGRTSTCSGSECLGELFFTIPFVASVAYSVGASIRRLLFPTSAVSVLKSR